MVMVFDGGYGSLLWSMVMVIFMSCLCMMIFIIVALGGGHGYVHGW